MNCWRTQPVQLPTRGRLGRKRVYRLYVVRHPRRDDLKEHLEANASAARLH